MYTMEYSSNLITYSLGALLEHTYLPKTKGILGMRFNLVDHSQKSFLRICINVSLRLNT